MTVRHVTGSPVGTIAAMPYSSAFRRTFFDAYPDVPQHPLDGPIPTD